MTSRDFCYWLQSAFELADIKAFDEKQTDLIRRHLALVFAHEIDPSQGPAKEQEKLNKIHGGVSKQKEKHVVSVPQYDGPPIIRC